MNGHEPLKRRWDENNSGPFLGTYTPFHSRFVSTSANIMPPPPPPLLPPPPPPPPPLPLPPPPPPPTTSSLLAKRKFLRFSALDDEMACAVVPPVTVVLEGRSICHRIHLHKHTSYESLAAALRRMFVDTDSPDGGDGETKLDLTNAVPGYMVAYEDMEDDLLLAGDLKWKDFVRVAKRIRILPAKTNRWKHCGNQYSTGGGITPM